MADYRPGTCNIGHAERRKRLLYGSAAFLAAGMVVAGSPLTAPAVVLSFATLLALGFLGIYQYRFAFCAGFAAAGVYDVSDGGDSRASVTDPDDRAADRRAAATLVAMSIGSSLLVTAIALLLA